MIFAILINVALANPSLNLSSLDKLQPQSEFKCFSKMQRLIEHEKPKGEWRRKVNPDMTLSFVRPTKTLSRWIRLERSRDLEVFKRQSPYDEMIVTFNRACESKMSVRKIDNYNLKGGFTDFELADLLSKNTKGLILSWSPGMNLSIVAIKNAQAAAKERKLPLTILLDPYADEKKAKALLVKEGLAGIEMKKISSFELISRNVLLHYPNLVMYKQGEITGPLVPGLMNVADYSYLAAKYLETK
ncbi:MAG: hypothetical protein LW878_03330 [Proteobacteria bacterium]|jgi:hypothetical protein|nr:hypothetical protein [Pseudomonadota bacterium]